MYRQSSNLPTVGSPVTGSIYLNEETNLDRQSESGGISILCRS